MAVTARDFSDALKAAMVAEKTFTAHAYRRTSAPRALTGVGKLRRAHDARMIFRFADLGGTVLAGSPADFGKLIAEETEKWGKVIRAANIKPD
jgi:hypothetical protein